MIDLRQAGTRNGTCPTTATSRHAHGRIAVRMNGVPAVVGSCGGIVLAGTHPWGRCVLDQAVPRPLLPVANRPLIRYAIEWMRHPDLGPITICGNSDTPLLRGGLAGESASGEDLDFYVDPMPRGPAGCVKDAAARQSCEGFVVADGTMVPEIDLEELLTVHQDSESVLTVVVARDGRDGTRRADQLIPVGIYVFSQAALAEVPNDGYQDIKESLIPRLYGQGLRVSAHLVESQAPRVKGADTYMAVNAWAVERICSGGERLPGHAALGESVVHETATVHPSARLIGPVVVGPAATVAREACVVGPSSIGSGSRVEAGAVVCRSIIWDGCTIEPEGSVDRCVLTDHAHVRERGVVRCTVVLSEQPVRRPVQRVRGDWPARKAKGSQTRVDGLRHAGCTA